MSPETSRRLSLAAVLFATVGSAQTPGAPATENGAPDLAHASPVRTPRLMDVERPLPGLEQMTRAELLARRAAVDTDRPRLWPWITMTVVGSVFVVGGLTVAIASGVGEQGDSGFGPFLAIGVPLLLAAGMGAVHLIIGAVGLSRAVDDQRGVRDELGPIERELAQRPAPPRRVEKSVGFHGALNAGVLAIDTHRGPLYGFAAVNVGVPLLTKGNNGALAFGLGPSFPLSDPDDSRWYLDLLATLLPGWNPTARCPLCALTPTGYLGLGGAVGLRYLHPSGFVFGLKVPIFGTALGPGAAPGGTAGRIGVFYEASLIALPMVSFGYRL